jgi:hypothetical protein
LGWGIKEDYMKYLLMAGLMAMSGTGFAAEQVENFTAKIFTAKGSVECLKKGTAAWVPVKAPFMLEVGDQVKTGPKSKAELYIKYGSKIRLGADTAFVIGSVAPEGNVVEVARGKMQAWIRKFAGRGFTVRTPAAVCAVRGTVLGVEVTEAGQATWDLFSGAMQVVDNRNRAIDLVPNQRLVVTQAEGAAAPVALPLSVEVPSEPSKIKEEKVEIKAEQVIIEAQQAPAAPPVAEPKEEVKEEVVAPVVEEPAPSVIPTQEVTESQEVSGSNP